MAKSFKQEVKNYLTTNKVLHKVYRALPKSFKRMYRDSQWKPIYKKWTNSQYYKDQRDDLLSLQNRFEGQTAVIMGNGPSLKKTDWNLIKDENTIGLNRISLLVDEMGFVPKILVCIKDLVIDQFFAEMDELDSIRFFDYEAGSKQVKDYQKDRYLISHQLSFEKNFETQVDLGWFRGFTVTYAAMQIAYYLGFKKVILIGVDHSFQTSGPSRRNVVSEGDDPNHFAPNYFGKGVKWALPDLDGSEQFYRYAKEAFEADGREIVDCTKGGKLEVFRKSELALEL